MSFDKRRILRKKFIKSQFSYCALIWMFHSRNLAIEMYKFLNELSKGFLNNVFHKNSSNPYTFGN